MPASRNCSSYAINSAPASAAAACPSRIAHYGTRWIVCPSRAPAPETSGAAKLVLVSFSAAWQAMEQRAYPGVTGTFVHPFDDHNFIAGHGTMGLEILEDAPETAAVIAGIGGGGLITGLASALKALKPGIRVFGAEPETAAPAALSDDRCASSALKSTSTWRR